MVRDWSVITGGGGGGGGRDVFKRGGGGGGKGKFLKGANKVLVMLKEGGTSKFWGSFYGSLKF